MPTAPKTYTYQSKNGYKYFVDAVEYILDDPTSLVCHANRTISDVVYHDGVWYTFDLIQSGQATTAFIRINGLMALIYPLEIAAAILIRALPTNA